MKKNVVKFLSAAVGALTVIGSMPAMAATPGEVGLSLAFDKQEYYCGETATVTLKLTDLAEEVAAGYTIGSFETHINFENMEYIPTESSFDVAFGSSDTSVLQVTNNFDDVLVASFDIGSSVGVSLGSGSSLNVATLKFKVNKNVEVVKAEIDADYDNVVMRPYGSDMSLDGKVLDCNVGAAVTAEASKYVISASPDADGNKVTADIVLGTDESVSGVLIAALYDKTTNLMQAPAVVQNVTVGGTYDVTFNDVTDNGNLEVRYFLWNSTGFLKPLLPQKNIDVK